MASYLPTKDETLSSWAANFSTLISESPGTYGLMAADAANIAGVVDAFAAALTLAINPATRTQAAVADKNGKRAAMKQVIRQYALMIKQNQGVSDAAKVDLGLTLSDATRTPIPAPSIAPALTLLSDGALRQTLHVSDPTDPTRKARPAGVQGVVLLAYIAPPPYPPSSYPPSSSHPSSSPSSTASSTAAPTPEQASFKQLVTRRSASVSYGPDDAGKLATVWGAYYNPAGELGPLSSPVSLLITG